ncbi:hypothetical protein AXF42_Ash017622 [Apostasia shenzhenica]|uniref:Uncharacterized protein n=1 Tax=Apostasia shenzhenica TaxID=1088818 RepID=A0A2I0A5C8_9ASPA|nr:hypothetical protein AXF42_Ash017622 [Apostasia shenzhenica]
MAHVAPSDWVPNGAPSEPNNFSRERVMPSLMLPLDSASHLFVRGQIFVYHERDGNSQKQHQSIIKNCFCFFAVHNFIHFFFV